MIATQRLLEEDSWAHPQLISSPPFRVAYWLSFLRAPSNWLVHPTFNVLDEVSWAHPLCLISSPPVFVFLAVFFLKPYGFHGDECLVFEVTNWDPCANKKSSPEKKWCLTVYLHPPILLSTPPFFVFFTVSFLEHLRTLWIPWGRVSSVWKWSNEVRILANDGSWMKLGYDSCPLSYPNFVRGPLLDDMRPFFGPCEVLGTHH